jgi:uncharacterized protein YfcZ (UPF0381/DUF406 family)
MFRKALTRYHERYLDHVPQALLLETSREVAAHILTHTVDLNTRFAEHPGCFVINGVLAGSDEAEPVRQVLIKARAQAERALRERFERAKAEGDLPESADPAALAAFLMAVMHGIAVQAKAGFPRATLEAVAAQALCGWPKAPVAAS